MIDKNLGSEKQNKRPKLQDIASALNLSTATVSRALRNLPAIHIATRRQVAETAIRFGYQINHNRKLSGKANVLHHVGILINTPFTEVTAPYLAGMTEAAMALNLSLTVHTVSPDTCEKILLPEFQPPAWRQGLLAGLVLVFRWPDEIAKRLSRMMPTISIMNKYPDTDMDMVGVDNIGGIELLIRHLYNLGHRKIGFFGRCNEVHWGKVRFAAYISALEGFGLNYDAELAVDVDFADLNHYIRSWDRYCEQAEQLTRKGVTAWVCVTEPAGWRLHAWMTAHNFKVPEDVSVTGFHKPDDSHYLDRPLTSVGTSYKSIGAAALKRLHNRIQNPSESSRTILFPCEFYAGETTGPAPLNRTHSG